MFILRHGKFTRSRNRFSQDHPRSYRADRHEAQAQRANLARRVDRQLAEQAIAEAFQDIDAERHQGDDADEGVSFNLIYGSDGKLQAACAV